MVVERFHIDVAVNSHLSVVANGVTHRGAVFQLCAAHPVIGSVIRGIGSQPVEDGQLVQWHLIAGRKGLTVVERTSEVLDALPYRVFPGMIAVGIEVFVDGQVAIRLFNLRLCARLEVHVQVLGEIPAYGEVTVPQELRTEGDRQ